MAQQYGLAVHEAPPPEDVTRFADTTSVNAMDYLRHQEGTQNATLLKLPNQRKTRMRTTKPGITRRIGGTSSR